MTLTRADLESNRLKEAFCQGNPEGRVLSDAELEASLSELLATHPEGQDIWVFGYGSLIWNPVFHFEQRQVARLHGYHRRFCLWSNVGRGTMQRPGLVLGLDSGGCCRGVAYRIRADHAAEELRLLWRREMVTGAYCPRWVRATTGETEVPALAFIINRNHVQYAGKLSEEIVVRAMVSARGFLGTPAEYLFETVRSLAEHGLRDPQLERLARQVRAALPDAAALA